MTDRYVDPDEAARILGIARDSVAKTMNRKGFHAVRTYRLSDVEAVRDRRQRRRRTDLHREEIP